jgi:membrane-associated phospholipid phosphatase
MLSALVWFVPFAVLPIAVVPVLVRSWPPPSAWPSAVAARVGSRRGALLVSGAGVFAVLVAGYLLGKVLALFEQSADVPLFRWAQGSQAGWWTSVNQVLTQMGGRLEGKSVAVLAAVVFAVLIRPFWVGPVLLGGAYATERALQQVLAELVDRGHPPTTLGTYPSGGCARIVAIYGTVALLLTVAGGITRRWRIAAWTAVALAASIEGYTRIYLLKHWATDVLGGWLFGAMVLAVAAAALAVLRQPGVASARWAVLAARPATPADLRSVAPGTAARPAGRGR